MSSWLRGGSQQPPNDPNRGYNRVPPDQGASYYGRGSPAPPPRNALIPDDYEKRGGGYDTQSRQRAPAPAAGGGRQGYPAEFVVKSSTPLGLL